MVPVVRVADGFHARVIAARLGSEGIVTQLRGGIDSPYPMGAVEVLVGEDDLEDAKALLLADEVESAFADEDDDEPDDEYRVPRRRYGAWVALVLAGLLVLADVAALAGRWS
ncbi:MAG: hypothetical protein JWN67_3014 [Actinomycetia bacterium]|nr:hypothetical protein [Actinomycetes bacterium]